MPTIADDAALGCVACSALLDPADAAVVATVFVGPADPADEAFEDVAAGCDVQDTAATPIAIVPATRRQWCADGPHSFAAITGTLRPPE